MSLFAGHTHCVVCWTERLKPCESDDVIIVATSNTETLLFYGIHGYISD